MWSPRSRAGLIRCGSDALRMTLSKSITPSKVGPVADPVVNDVAVLGRLQRPGRVVARDDGRAEDRQARPGVVTSTAEKRCWAVLPFGLLGSTALAAASAMRRSIH